MENFISTLTIVVLILVVFLILKRKKNQSQPPKTYLGCTLPALLFIIFVPIILLGIGYIAYDGMAKSQMSYDTNKIHEQVVKYMRTELKKCKLGKATAMDGLIKCSNYTADKTIKVVVGMMTDVNIHNASDLAVRASNSNINDEDVGYISLSVSASGSDIIIKSCHRKPCNEEKYRRASKVDKYGKWTESSIFNSIK